ncbi:MAG: hypothetical protein JEZ09_05665 [Salinivirgaceae bacterium]|nr:hypothetical protein [Salinivirgaceae bacterium]
MNPITKVFLKLILFCVLVISTGIIYKLWFFEDDLQKHSNIINLVRAVQDSSDIIYIGESSNFSFRSDDNDKRPISEFIAEYYPEKKLGTISKGALHSGIYKELLKQIPLTSNVKTVIVTLNLRSFNANWIYSDLETPLQKSIVLLKSRPAFFNRFVLAFKGYDIKDNKERERQFKRKWKNDPLILPDHLHYQNVIEWDNAMAQAGVVNENGIMDYNATELACHYIKTYAFQIDTTTNQRILDFDEIVELSKERNWNLVFNLLAENLEKAQNLVGSELVDIIKQNKKLLVDKYSSKGVIVVDNLNNIRNELFIDQDWTTEHYNEEGRKKIAKNVADSIMKFYPKQYVKVEYEKLKLKTHFFHDCEISENWGQMNTISSEKSFSGNHSSKTGMGNDFSLTLEHSVKSIPDSLFNTISVKAYIYQKAKNEEAKLVCEVKGEFIDNYWGGVFIKDLCSLENEWKKIEYNFKIPRDKKNADLIKIYIYNPTKKEIYVDDLRIDFN